MSYFSSKHAALRSKSKDWLARNQNNVSEFIALIKLKEYTRYANF
jgi:hypothetical protein